MRAWIARDADGDLYLYDKEPEWNDWQSQFVNSAVSQAMSLDGDLFSDLPNGHKQQIELTARPIGEAEGGGT